MLRHVTLHYVRVENTHNSSLVCKVLKNVSVLELNVTVSVSNQKSKVSVSEENFGRSRSYLGLKIRSLGLGPQRLIYILEFWS